LESGSDRRGRLAEGNAAFRKATDQTLFANLSKGQHPSFAILSCSDSRVVPEKLFNLSLGDAFVVRVAGNSAADSSVLGSLEYAVEHLHVRELVVLGHTGCGAVKLAMEGASPGSLGSVIRDLERAKSKVPVEFENDPDAVAESNVKLQLRLLEDNSHVIRSAVEKGELVLHGAMYDIRTGTVRFFSSNSHR
jgi:carbonic anhydrase